jgi:hypothetical protein
MEIEMSQNSYATYLLGIYRAMFVDIVGKHPHLQIDCERDYKRLLSAVEQRGIRVFLIDLPELGKHFDKCLSSGQLTSVGLPLSRPYKTGVVVPRLFKGLLLSVFNSFGVLRDDPDITSIEFLRQLYLAGKRFRMECDDSDTRKTVHEFFEIDRECRQPNACWNAGDHSFVPDTSNHLCDATGIQLELFPDEGSLVLSPTLDRVKYVAQWAADLLTSEFGSFDGSEWRAKHGPGAVADLRRGTSKYSFPAWQASLESVFPYADWAFSSYQHWVDQIDNQISSSDGISKLIAVPKTLSAPRLIASEPVANQWCQQVILRFLVDKVRSGMLSSCIDFSSQEENRKAVLKASHTTEYATIDLSSASDRISCWLVERIFRRNLTLLRAFYAVRTRYISNEIDRESPSCYALKKFSTMGSALTFPVQSIIFAIVSAAVVHAVRERPLARVALGKSLAEVRVFGDDIIVPTDCWELTQVVLGDLGLKVNPNKSFGTGKFRESCGCDAYDGHDVSRVSVLSTPEVSRPGSIVSAVDTHNNFYSRGYFATATFIRSTVAKGRMKAIPSVRVGSGAFGWYDELDYRNGNLQRRFNVRTQQVEMRALTLRNVSSRAPTEGHQMVLQYFTEVCKPPISREERLGVPSEARSNLAYRWVLASDIAA